MIKRGYVRLYSISKDGEEFTLIIFKKSDFFPFMWVINNTPNEYYLAALGDITFWRAPKEAVLTFIKENPDVLFELTSRLLVRFGGVLRRMEYLAFGNAHAKVASILLICAERFGKVVKKGVVIDVPLTHSDVAALCALSRETVSIEMKKLERDGLISYRGRRIIVNKLSLLRRDSSLTSED